MEIRTYFDGRGNVIYQDNKLKKGEGWSGGFKEAILNPKEDYRMQCE